MLFICFYLTIKEENRDDLLPAHIAVKSQSLHSPGLWGTWAPLFDKLLRTASWSLRAKIPAALTSAKFKMQNHESASLILTVTHQLPLPRRHNTEPKRENPKTTSRVARCCYFDVFFFVSASHSTLTPIYLRGFFFLHMQYTPLFVFKPLNSISKRDLQVRVRVCMRDISRYNTT